MGKREVVYHNHNHLLGDICEMRGSQRLGAGRERQKHNEGIPGLRSAAQWMTPSDLWSEETER